jgi:hypothetical protein
MPKTKAKLKKRELAKARSKVGVTKPAAFFFFFHNSTLQGVKRQKDNAGLRTKSQVRS